MTKDPFAGVLDPFAWWDISATYDRYSAFFDVVIYCSLFIALSHAILGGRFTGRPGKVLASVLGIALGVSLVLVEQQFGWNLRMASPIAALLALLLVGFLLLQTLVRVHVPWSVAMPLTYILLYLFLRAISPTMVTVVSDRVPFIHLLTAVMFLICVWRIGVAVWPSTGIRVSRDANDARMVAELDRPTEKREFRLLKRIKRHMVPEAQHETARLEHSLEALKQDLNREVPNWPEISRASGTIARKADEVIQSIDRVRTLDRRIRSFDLRELGQLNAYYQELSEQDRERLKQQILLERGKIIQEHAIDNLTDRCERRHQEFRRLMDVLCRAAEYKDRTAASQAVAQAVALEQEQLQDMKRLRRAEKLLLQATGRKLREEKHV